MEIETYACGKCKSTSLYKDVNVDGPVYIACRICGNRWPGSGAKPVKVTREKDDMGTITGVFVDGKPFISGIDADDDEDGISELKEAFPDPTPPGRGGVRAGAGRKKNAMKMLTEGAKQKDIAVATGSTPGKKKAQGSAIREAKFAERRKLVMVALREGGDLKEIRAKCRVGKATVKEVFEELCKNGENLKCRCGREIMHRGGCKGELARIPLPIIPQEKPAIDKIIPSEKKEINPKTITALKAEIRSRYEAKISGLKTKMDIVLAALDELID